MTTPSPHHDHTPEAIRERLARGAQTSYLRDFLFGAVDGIVTTFAVVAGVAGAGLSARVVLVLGAANLFGDGFSMAVSNYLGTQADRQRLARARRLERQHVHTFPEGEREEVRQIFASKGFEGDDLERIVRTLTEDEERWIDTMLVEEHGLALRQPVALRAAWTTFLAFVAVGALPLLPYVPGPDAWAWTSARPFRSSAVITGLAFLTVGALKGRVTGSRGWSSGAETLAVGGGAALIAFLVGRWVGSITA